MQFHSIHTRGLGPFRAPTHVDIDALPGPIVAVTGSNGTGKSTFLELLFGAIARDTPTHGSLVDLAKDRDAFLEVRATNGSAHTFRHVLDGVSKKSEALVLDAAGAPVLATTSVKSFDAWAKLHLPDPSVLLASIFSAQEAGGGFCGASPRERKEILATLLGITHLGEMAERAKARGAAVRLKLSALEGELRALPILETEALRAQLPIAEENARIADGALATGRRDADAAIAYRRVSAALIADRAKLVDLEERITNNQKLLADADGIRAAADRCRAIREEVIALSSQEQSAAAAGRAIEQRRQEASTRAAQARDAIHLAETRAQAARSRAARRAEVEAAEAEQPIALDRVAEIETTIARLREEERRVQDGALGGAESRVKGLRGGLGKIALPSGSVSDRKPHQVARATLDADSAIAEAQKSAPRRLAEIRAALANELQALDRARARVTELAAIAGLRATVDAADSDLARAIEDGERARAAEQEASAAALAIGAEAEAARRAGSERGGKIAELEREEQALARCALFLDKVNTAAEVLAIRERDAGDVRAAIAKHEADLATLPPPAEIDVPALEEAAWRAHAAVTRLMTEIERAEAAATRRGAIDAEIAGLQEEFADWELLAEDLGKTLPALLIDAAGPELTELTNDLIHTCVGPRFTIEIVTTRPSADGKKTFETCDVRVLDTVEGREDVIERFSPGQRVLLAEGVSLALAVHACQRSGAENPTLVRDESGAALDPANGRAWMAMLRRAAEITKASKVLLVTHSPELQALADSRLVVANGTVTVEAA